MARRPRTLAWAVALTLAAWFASLLAFAAAGQAIGVQLTIGEAALMASGVALATAVPSAPGYLGTFELAGVTITTGFGIPVNEGFAIALLAHASVLATTSLGGAVALARIGWLRSTEQPLTDLPPTQPSPTAPDLNRSRSSAGPASG